MKRPPNTDILTHDFSPNISSLRRCTKCILPETMTFIEFDENGVCNYCRSYKKMEVKGEAALREVVAKYRSKSGEPDCIVTFSGGRDSSYGLHYIKTVLGMNPIAYTYDWGMTTDLAYRNQTKMCEKLGVEHKVILSNIKRKRENIRKNTPLRTRSRGRYSRKRRIPFLGICPSNLSRKAR